VFRHTAFFLFKEDTTQEQGVEMLKGLAYMRFECESVMALDYGFDLFGGSEALRTVKPWDRTPRWRAREAGPPCNYDVALMLDFTDRAGNEAYNDDDTHHAVAEYNASICRGSSPPGSTGSTRASRCSRRATSGTRRCSCGRTMPTTTPSRRL